MTLDQSASLEDSTSDAQTRLQHEYLNALERAKAFGRAYPVLSIFCAIFATLSFIPVACFVGTSIFILSTFILVSLTFAILAGATIIAALGTALLGTLFLLSLLSLLLTTLAVLVYLAVRLLVLLHAEGSLRAGVVLWAREARGYVCDRLPQREGGGMADYLAAADANHDTYVVPEVTICDGKAHNRVGVADFGDEKVKGKKDIGEASVKTED